MISVAAYLTGMLITEIFIIVHDNFATFEHRFDNPEIVAMLWPMTVPLIGLYALFKKLYKIAKDIGNEISMKLRDKGNER
jgi:hydrogenase maturation factor